MYYRVLDGTEGSGVSVTVSGNTLPGLILVFRGLSAFDVAAIQTVVNTPNPILPAVTPTRNTSVVVQIHGGGNSTGGAIDAHTENTPNVLDQITGGTNAASFISWFETTTTSEIAAETLDELALNNYYQGIRAVFKKAVEGEVTMVGTPVEMNGTTITPMVVSLPTGVAVGDLSVVAHATNYGASTPSSQRCRWCRYRLQVRQPVHDSLHQSARLDRHLQRHGQHCAPKCPWCHHLCRVHGCHVLSDTRRFNVGEQHRNGRVRHARP